MGFEKLSERCNDGLVKEVILATNFTGEGEATAHVIAEMLKKRGLRVTRLARGVPAGSELEYVDLGTIAHALVDRRWNRCVAISDGSGLTVGLDSAQT